MLLTLGCCMVPSMKTSIDLPHARPSARAQLSGADTEACTCVARAHREPCRARALPRRATLRAPTPRPFVHWVVYSCQYLTFIAPPHAHNRACAQLPSAGSEAVACRRRTARGWGGGALTMRGGPRSCAHIIFSYLCRRVEVRGGSGSVAAPAVRLGHCNILMVCLLHVPRLNFLNL
jgi:hypothetical protein